MTLLVRDEEDIVAANLDYHLSRGVDFVLVTDNRSADCTSEILRSYPPGVLRVIDEPDDNYQQGRWVTRMARLAATEHGADWIIHCDADEFWWPERGTLREAVAAVPLSFGIASASRYNFLPSANEAGPFYERLHVKDLRSQSPLGRALPSKCCHRAHPQALVAQGNHKAAVPGLRMLPEPLPISILHFPLRSYAQFERKIVLGGLAYSRNRELPDNVGNNWRWLYQRYIDGELRDWYFGQVPAPGYLLSGLASGRLTIDTRLRDYCRTMGISKRPASGMRP